MLRTKNAKIVPDSTPDDGHQHHALYVADIDTETEGQEDASYFSFKNVWATGLFVGYNQPQNATAFALLLMQGFGIFVINIVGSGQDERNVVQGVSGYCKVTFCSQTISAT
jgi:hypothetical protein